MTPPTVRPAQPTPSVAALLADADLAEALYQTGRISARTYLDRTRQAEIHRCDWLLRLLEDRIQAAEHQRLLHEELDRFQIAHRVLDSGDVWLIRQEKGPA